MEEIGTVVERIGQDLVAVQPAPSPGTLWATMLIGVLAVLWSPVWRRVRHGVTIVHEGGHAVMAMLCGRRLQGIRLHSDTSGLTVSRGRPTGPGMVATAFAGYPAPSVVGVVAALLVADGRAFAALWATVLLLALMLVAIRNLYGLLVILLAGGAAIGVSWWASADVKVAVSYVVTWVLLLGAPRAALELAAERRRTRSGRSDADQLARLTPLPAGVWVALFLLFTGGAAVIGAAALTANAEL